jgi:hypothetical protein
MRESTAADGSARKSGDATILFPCPLISQFQAVLIDVFRDSCPCNPHWERAWSVGNRRGMGGPRRTQRVLGGTTASRGDLYPGVTDTQAATADY